MQQRDCLFLQNTKPYLTVYLGFVVLIFLIFNKLLMRIFSNRLDAGLRVYAFGLYMMVILVLQNVQTLSVLAINNFLSMFSLTYRMMLVQAATVLLIGLIFFQIVWLFPMCIYFYRKLSSYFLSNVLELRGCYSIMFIQLVAKPIL